MIIRLYTEKKDAYSVSSMKLLKTVKSVLNINAEDVREFARYDIEGISDGMYQKAKTAFFYDLPLDKIYEEILPDLSEYKTFCMEYLPGQYDQRADMTAESLLLLTKEQRPLVRCARVIAIKGITDKELQTVKNYLINPVESRECSFDKPNTLVQKTEIPDTVEILEAFIKMTEDEIREYHNKSGFAMTVADLISVRNYFAGENRPPTVTELKVIDTYWSDHCRHTTFLTEITDIKVISNNPHIEKALSLYNDLFKEINKGRSDKYRCLMDIATIAGKKLVREGLLDNLDVSEEINACSIIVNVDNDGIDEEWLIMFKNETHNHPTEIEPFGGAATCLGGAIRDPLSGRVYVYQGMRVTGAGDPTESINKTMKGKLPQRVLTQTATAGFSSYGNQIGLPAGLVEELYHSGYRAKRMEAGFVIGGARRENVIRRSPIKGDIVVLLGGDTGRDGCGGATGSSKAHTVESVDLCSAEVQKGNPLIERNIQRLFRKAEASKLIVKCNDFGAGGVSVAIGELSDGIDIDLDKVPVKYAGLDGTELAISESQERMAVMLPKENVEKFIRLAEEENLKCTPVAQVTNLNRVRMFWKGNTIVDISRDFLNTNGVKQTTTALIKDNISEYFNILNDRTQMMLDKGYLRAAVLSELKRLNVASNKGMVEHFDPTIGANAVILPFGGKYQLTPANVMAAKVPVSGETDTATVCSYSCYPDFNVTSPFTGAVYAIVASVAKLAGAGVDYKTARLTLQEFFKKLGNSDERWGEPLSALLGAMYAQINLGLGAIGGKDSMSGSFHEIDVPPTLISFAVGIGKASRLLTNVWTTEGNLYLLRLRRDKNNLPDFEYAKKLWQFIYDNRDSFKACQVVEEGGAISAIVKAASGNKAGVEMARMDRDLFCPLFGDIIVQADSMPEGVDYELIATLNNKGNFRFNNMTISNRDLTEALGGTLEEIFPVKAESEGAAYEKLYNIGTKTKGRLNIADPKVFIPVFPGTNGEYDLARRFEMAGAVTDSFVIRTRSGKDIEKSIREIARRINDSQILAFAGGASAGNEPDGSGKYIAAMFREPAIAEAIMNLLYKRDGLILGICNGFQALIRLGLVPYGEITDFNENSPALTRNTIGRHVSTMSRIKVVSNKSPWLNNVKCNSEFRVPVSCSEGRLVAPETEIIKLSDNGQIATQYIDFSGNVTMESPYNPSGSVNGIEGLLSPDGRVFGKMGHSERIDNNLYINLPDDYDMKIFESGVGYYK